MLRYYYACRRNVADNFRKQNSPSLDKHITSSQHKNHLTKLMHVGVLCLSHSSQDKLEFTTRLSIVTKLDAVVINSRILDGQFCCASQKTEIGLLDSL